LFANKSSKLSDYGVCKIWGVWENKLHLLRLLRKRLDYPDLRGGSGEAASFAIRSQEHRYRGQSFRNKPLQDLREDGVHGATGYETQMDKIMGTHSVSSTIENGFVYIPTQAERLPECLREVAAIPKGKDDDRVDATSQA
jgi:predicted phage terminase large subunit-like protein